MTEVRKMTNNAETPAAGNLEKVPEIHENPGFLDSARIQGLLKKYTQKTQHQQQEDRHQHPTPNTNTPRKPNQL